MSLERETLVTATNSSLIHGQRLRRKYRISPLFSVRCYPSRQLLQWALIVYYQFLNCVQVINVSLPLIPSHLLAHLLPCIVVLLLDCETFTLFDNKTLWTVHLMSVNASVRGLLYLKKIEKFHSPFHR